MKKLIILGDVHCNFLRCQDVALRNPDALIVQLGDLGVGFVPREVIENLPPNFLFFPGNHDNRNIANSFPSCLGDFGHVLDYRSDVCYHNLFFVSGADSKDRANRIEGVNWWPNEELDHRQCERCFSQWVDSDAQVLISHDMPQRIAESYYLIYDKTRTRQLLDRMVEARAPKFVVFGHHHRPFNTLHEGVYYSGLRIDETISFDISTKHVRMLG